MTAPKRQAREIEKWREDIQACLDNLPAYANEVGLSKKEVAGREYAYSYALAAMSDIQEVVAIESALRSPGGEEELREALEDARWRLACIVQMHSIDGADGPPTDSEILGRCFEEAQKGLAAAREVLSKFPRNPPALDPGKGEA